MEDQAERDSQSMGRVPVGGFHAGGGQSHIYFDVFIM